MSLLVWIFAHQADAAIILVTTADMLGFVPTVRKSWAKPYQETLFLYALTAFRFALAIYALQHYNLVTLLYPLTWMIANASFSLFLIIRRKQLA